MQYEQCLECKMTGQSNSKYPLIYKQSMFGICICDFLQLSNTSQYYNQGIEKHIFVPYMKYGCQFNNLNWKRRSTYIYINNKKRSLS